MKIALRMPKFVSYRNFITSLTDGCFGPSWLNQEWGFSFLAVIGLLGAWFWFWFLDGANFTAEDWPRELSYLSILEHSLSSGVIPWHCTLITQMGTTRFLTIPEVAYTPQIFLLWVLNVKNFVIVNILILYGVGFIGCLKLARRFQMSAFAFLFFVILFNFNGYLTSHLAIGHQMWASIFYFPWFFCFLFDLIASPGCRKNVLKLALILFFILLQGGLHQYVWCNMFLALLFLFRSKLRMPLLLTIIFAGLASSYRILPAAWGFWKFQRPFISGYPNLEILLQGLTTIGTDNTPTMGGLFNPMHWWEYDIFIGAAGLLALIWYGLITPKMNRSQELAGNLGLLGSAMVVILFLSISDVYQFVNQLHLPLLYSEVVSSRFIILPFFLLLLMASDAMSVTLKKNGELSQGVVVILLLGTCYLLYLHASLWRVQSLEQISHAPLTVNLAELVAGKPDSTYHSVIIGSYLLSLISIGGIIFWWRRNNGRIPHSS